MLEEASSSFNETKAMTEGLSKENRKIQTTSTLLLEEILHDNEQVCAQLEKVK